DSRGNSGHNAYSGTRSRRADLENIPTVTYRLGCPNGWGLATWRGAPHRPRLRGRRWRRRGDGSPSRNSVAGRGFQWSSDTLIFHPHTVVPPPLIDLLSDGLPSQQWRQKRSSTVIRTGGMCHERFHSDVSETLVSRPGLEPGTP